MKNMKQRFRQQSFTIRLLAVSFFLSLIAPGGEAQDFFAGVRGGTSIDTAQGRFYQAEAFAGWKMPWRWNFCSHWSLRPSVDLSAGGISAKAESGFVGTLGPSVELRYGKFPVVLEGGASPTWLSRYVFGPTDFGEPFQFTSHIGLEWDVTKNFTVGLRFQHMSNAGLANPNPGLNIGMLSARFNF